MFRPVAMEWVELLVEREAAPRTLAALARGGLMELQRALPADIPFQLAETEDVPGRLRRLEAKVAPFRAVLPAPSAGSAPDDPSCAAPAPLLDAVEGTLQQWLPVARPLIRELHDIDCALDNLDLLDECLAALPPEGMDLTSVGQAAAARDARFRPWLALAGPAAADLGGEPMAQVLVQSYAAGEGASPAMVMLGVADRAALPELERSLQARGARFVRLPAWLAGTPRAARHRLAARRAALARSRETRLAAIDRLSSETGMAQALWRLRRCAWLADALERTGAGRRFTWISGWVPQRRAAELAARLEKAGIAYVVTRGVHRPPGPVPTLMRNPGWIRGFELFVRGLGVPSRTEVDPSPLLALVMPLIFGYMFGDLGQGAVLLLAGALLRLRLPAASLLVPAGLASMAFGWAYGSLFFAEGIIAPLWIRPMDDPLTILLLPLLLGIGLVATSMALAGLEAYWRGETARWLGEGLPLLAVYLGAAGALVAPRAGFAVIDLALLWRLAAAGARGYAANGWLGAPAAVALAVAQLAEQAVQLATNTLSFARVGAFALAHAGLGLLVITLAAQGESLPWQAAAWLLGNAVAVVLEALVVGIQTTRLMMFEFFRRFLQGEGRPFRPLRLPEVAAGLESGATPRAQ